VEDILDLYGGKRCDNRAINTSGLLDCSNIVEKFRLYNRTAEETSATAKELKISTLDF
jgi:hypothetical protein